MKKGARKGKQGKEVVEDVDLEPAEVNQFELGAVERDCCKQNFLYYDSQNRGYVERFELPMLLEVCGYNLPDEKIKKLNDFMDENGATQIDLKMMLKTLTFLKELELQDEQNNESDEYLDCFVALGGQQNKEGSVSKETLIQIIKEEFELTIDMEEFLRKLGGSDDEINYYHFCVLLDAGTGGNPSRVSSYLSQNKGSSAFMRFSYFVNNMDKIQFK